MHAHEKNIQLKHQQSTFYDNLYRSLYDRLYQYGLTICTSAQLVEDSLQEVFEYFMTNQGDLDHVDNVQAYLSTSLRHRIFKKLSQEQRTLLTDQLPESLLAESAEYRLIIQETKNLQIKKIQYAMAQLSEGECDAIKSRFLDEKSYEAIAKENNSTKRTVYNQVHNGIKKLRFLF